MNPFVQKENAGHMNNEVTRTTLASSNPPKPYARGGSEMLRKLLSISENTRRQLACGETASDGRQDANGERGETGRRTAVSIPLLGRASKRKAAAEELDEVVIDLVSEDEDKDGTQGPRPKSQTGVALFDVFDEDGSDDADVEDDAGEVDECEVDGLHGRIAGDCKKDDAVRDDPAAPLIHGDLCGLTANVDGKSWWRKLPDFQPISSIIQAGNRDARGSSVFVDFLGQFIGTRASPQGRGGRGRKSMSKNTGHWETRDGVRTFFTATGTAMTGIQAYREYSKSGAARKTGGEKPRGGGKRTRKKSSRKRSSR